MPLVGMLLFIIAQRTENRKRAVFFLLSTNSTCFIIFSNIFSNINLKFLFWYDINNKFVVICFVLLVISVEFYIKKLFLYEFCTYEYAVKYFIIITYNHNFDSVLILRNRKRILFRPVLVKHQSKPCYSERKHGRIKKWKRPVALVKK